MKVFVYSKKSSKTVAYITNVNSVKTRGEEIIFITEDGVIHKFYVNQVKSTIYQN